VGLYTPIWPKSGQLNKSANFESITFVVKNHAKRCLKDEISTYDV
jgi:hypothetical protein